MTSCVGRSLVPVFGVLLVPAPIKQREGGGSSGATDESDLRGRVSSRYPKYGLELVSDTPFSTRKSYEVVVRDPVGVGEDMKYREVFSVVGGCRRALSWQIGGPPRQADVTTCRRGR